MPEARANPDVSVAEGSLLSTAARHHAASLAIATILAGGNTACETDWYVDPSICASTWLGAIADHAYRPDGVA
jgi:hypothetical protein